MLLPCRFALGAVCDQASLAVGFGSHERLMWIDVIGIAVVHNVALPMEVIKHDL
jgi:hypothetical protein